MLTNCGKGAISTKIEGFTIQGGCAQHFENKGGSDDSSRNEPEHSSAIETGVYYADYYEPLNDINTGAGFYNSHGSPTILKCVIKRNYSNVNGGGMFSRAGPALIENCLFDENYSYQGYGGGACITLNPGGKIYGSVFDNNEVGDRELYAGGLFTTSSNLSIINSIFTRNIGPAAGASIFNTNGYLSIINCTFTRNHGITGAGGVENRGNARTEIINTILWNNDGGELEGDSFSVSYSCVEGGYAGVGNISGNPMFVDYLKPKGTNGKYGDFDDGLYLQVDSPCKEKGTDQNAPQKDILCTYRPYYDSVDIGAYEYADFQDQKNVFGIIREGQFIPKIDVDILDELPHGKYVHLYSKSNYARVLKIKIPRNKHTKNNTEIYLFLRGIDNSGSPLPNSVEVTIRLTRVSMNNSNIYYQSKTDSWGKYILFAKEPDFQTWDNPWAYVIYVDSDANLFFRMPHSQFK